MVSAAAAGQSWKGPGSWWRKPLSSPGEGWRPGRPACRRESGGAPADPPAERETCRVSPRVARHVGWARWPQAQSEASPAAWHGERAQRRRVRCAARTWYDWRSSLSTSSTTSRRKCESVNPSVDCTCATSLPRRHGGGLAGLSGQALAGGTRLPGVATSTSTQLANSGCAPSCDPTRSTRASASGLSAPLPETTATASPSASQRGRRTRPT